MGDICALLGIEAPDQEVSFKLIRGLAPLHEAKADEITFFSNTKYLDDLKNTKAGFCILQQEFVSHLPSGTIPIVTEKPYRAWGKVAQHFYPTKPESEGISPFARIHPSARIGDNCHIGANTIVGPLAEIGNNSYIDDSVVISRGVVIGDHCFISPHVTISHTVMGNHVVIKPGARIGQPGFGFDMDDKGHFDVPQLGTVVIGNNVWIGANTCIDRGSQRETIIGNGVRIDNLVQIAHNVEIGDNSVIVAQAGIAGSTKLGRFVITAGQVGIAGHLNVGDGVKIAAQSGIMRDIKPGETVGGSPAVPVREWHRQTIAIQKLGRGDK